MAENCTRAPIPGSVGHGGEGASRAAIVTQSVNVEPSAAQVRLALRPVLLALTRSRPVLGMKSGARHGGAGYTCHSHTHR